MAQTQPKPFTLRPPRENVGDDYVHGISIIDNRITPVQRAAFREHGAICLVFCGQCMYRVGSYGEELETKGWQEIPGCYPCVQIPRAMHNRPSLVRLRKWTSPARVTSDSNIYGIA